MARPVLTGLRALAGANKSSVAVLLDNSYSMDTVSGNRSTFAHAKEVADRALHELPRGSEASVLLMGGSPVPVLTSPAVAHAKPLQKAISYQFSLRGE